MKFERSKQEVRMRKKMSKSSRFGRYIRNRLTSYGWMCLFCLLFGLLATSIVFAQGVDVSFDIDWMEYVGFVFDWMRKNPFEFIGVIVVGVVVYKIVFGKK